MANCATKGSLLYVVAFILLVASIQASWFNDETELYQPLLSADADADYFQNDRPEIPLPSHCSITCKGEQNRFNYAVGSTYEYGYEGNVKTTVPRAISEHSSLHLKATVSLDVLSICDLRLRLTDVSVMDSNPASYEKRSPVQNSKEIRRALQASSFRFSFSEGRIDETCVSSADLPWVVNVYRAIASSFQNAMTSQQGASFVRETDVHGDCPTRYEVVSSSTWSSTMRVKKTKDLVSCVKRNSVNSMLQGVPYLSKSNVQSLPILKGAQTCEQEIDSGRKIVTKIGCTESYVLKPMSSATAAGGGGGGATTEADYSLTFNRDYPSPSINDQDVERVSSTLQFDHTTFAPTGPESVNAVRATLSEACDPNSDLVRSFSALQKQLKLTDDKGLNSLARDVRQMCPKAQSMWKDSLPLIQTASSIRLIKNLMRTKQLSKEDADAFYASLAFIRRPTAEIVGEIKSLLTSDYERSALGVGSLLNQFCSSSSSGCSDDDVRYVMKVFEEELKYNCKTDNGDQEEARMVRTLKAIGNAGSSASRVTPSVLINCASNAEASMRIRVAAVEAFRRFDCALASRENLFSLLENKKQDSELRIHAYLQIMACADKSSVDRVRRLLEVEEVNQVGSFIWTHLTNLREAESPLRSQLNDIVSDVTLQKTFDMDSRKFSRNLEVSSFSEYLNVGASAESNLIFSQQSFVPRSGNINVTVDLFGEEVNLLEIGARMEGLEDYLQSFWDRKNYQESRNNFNSKKEKSTDCDSALIPLLCVHG